MKTIEGVIEKIEIGSGSNTKGPWTNYKIKVKNYPKPISTFDTTVGKALESGKAYSFQVEEKERDGKVYINLVTNTTPEEVAFPMPEEQQKAHLLGGNGSDYQDTKDLSIRRQVALKAAVELVGYIIEHSNQKYVGPERVLSIAEGFDAWLNGQPAGTPTEAPDATEPHEKASSVDAATVSEGQDATDLRVLIKEALAKRWPDDTEGRNVAAFCNGFGQAKTVDEIPAEMLPEALEMAPGPKRK